MLGQKEKKLPGQIPSWLRDMWCPPDLRKKMEVPGLAVPISQGLEKVLVGAVRVEAVRSKVLACGKIGLKPVLIDGVVDKKGLVGEIIVAGKNVTDRIGFFIPNKETKSLMMATMDEALGVLDNRITNTVRWYDNDDREIDLWELGESWKPALGPLSRAVETITANNEVIFFTGQRAYLDSLDCMGIQAARLYAGMMEILVSSQAWRVGLRVEKAGSISRICLDRVSYEPISAVGL